MNTIRMCDGQPRHECKFGCGVDCNFNSVELARDMAAREFYEPDYSRTTVTPSAWIRATDWVGNLSYRFDRWWDRASLKARAVLAGFAIALGFAVSGVLTAFLVVPK